MKREKNIFEIEIQMHNFQRKARDELKKAIKEEEKEFDCEEQVEKLLRKLEQLDKDSLKEIKEKLSNENLRKKAEYLLKDIEQARNNLENNNLHELKQHLEEINDILSSSNFAFPEEKEDHWAQYFVENALHGVNRAIEFEEAEAELEGHTEELLKRIESADKAEISQVTEKLESDNLENGFEVEIEEKCRELWKDTEKAREHLRNGNYKKALQYVQEVGKILDAIEMDLEHIERLEEKYSFSQDNALSGGGNSTVYTLDNRDDLLIKFHGTLRQSKKLKKLIDQVPDEVNIMPIVEVGLYSGEPVGKNQPAEIIKKAPGRELNQDSEEASRKLMTDIANAPQSHFNNLVRDTETLIKYGLTPDASIDNIFYSKEHGFVWIDPLPYDITKRMEKGLDRDRTNYFSFVFPMSYASNEKDRENARKIVSKLKKAGAQQPDKSLDEALAEFVEGYDPDLPDWVDS